jgi:hypothetical protein
MASGARTMRRFLRPRNSTRGARYPVQQGPPCFQGLCSVLGLPAHVQIAWWRALCAARWSQADAWREQLETFHPAGQDSRAFVEEACSPPVVVELLELLTLEGVLRRQSATAIEEQILAQLDAQGRWRGTDPRGNDP